MCVHVLGSALGETPTKDDGAGAIDPFLHIKSLKLSAINLHLTLVILDGAIVRQFVGATMERYSFALSSSSLLLFKRFSVFHDDIYKYTRAQDTAQFKVPGRACCTRSKGAKGFGSAAVRMHHVYCQHDDAGPR